MEKLVKVKDMFNIYLRLKDIDPRYKLFFNKETNRYEVYIEKNMGNMALAFVSPYESVDKRLLDYARRTRIENLDAIILEIEENNKKIEKEEVKEISEKKESKLESIINYLKKR